LGFKNEELLWLCFLNMIIIVPDN